MPPPTKHRSTPTCTAQPAHGDEAALYRRHHHDLHRAVARAVRGPREVVEDACQHAWTTLVRVQPDRGSIFGWLYVVAVREAWRLCERDQRELSLDAIDPGAAEHVLIDASAIETFHEVRDALRIVAELPDRQRDDLALLIAGFSYAEIARMTGGRTFTNVNKHLARARARARLERLLASREP